MYIVVPLHPCMNQDLRQPARNPVCADLLPCGSLMQSDFPIYLNTSIRLGICACQAGVNTVCDIHFANKKPVSSIEVNVAKAGVNQDIKKYQGKGYTKIQDIFYRVAKKYLGEHVERQIKAGDASGNNPKFISLYPVPYQTLNRSI